MCNYIYLLNQCSWPARTAICSKHYKQPAMLRDKRWVVTQLGLWHHHALGATSVRWHWGQAWDRASGRYRLPDTAAMVAGPCTQGWNLHLTAKIISSIFSSYFNDVAVLPSFGRRRVHVQNSKVPSGKTCTSWTMVIKCFLLQPQGAVSDKEVRAGSTLTAQACQVRWDEMRWEWRNKRILRKHPWITPDSILILTHSHKLKGAVEWVYLSISEKDN